MYSDSFVDGGLSSYDLGNKVGFLGGLELFEELIVLFVSFKHVEETVLSILEVVAVFKANLSIAFGLLKDVSVTFSKRVRLVFVAFFYHSDQVLRKFDVVCVALDWLSCARGFKFDLLYLLEYLV